MIYGLKEQSTNGVSKETFSAPPEPEYCSLSKIAKVPITGNVTDRCPGLSYLHTSDAAPVTVMLFQPVGGLTPVAEEKSSLRRYTCENKLFEKKASITILTIDRILMRCFFMVKLD